MDVGLTHVALTVTDPGASRSFYARYAGMEVVHERVDPQTGATVLWLSDRTRPFVIVLIEVPEVVQPLAGVHHLGVGVASRDEVDRLVAQARDEDRLAFGPDDHGYPVGYFAIIRDPDGHNLEVSFGQEVGLAVERADDHPPS